MILQYYYDNKMKNQIKYKYNLYKNNFVGIKGMEKIFQFSQKTLKKVVSTWEDSQELYETTRTGNKINHRTIIPCSNSVEVEINKILHSRYFQHQQTAAKHLLANENIGSLLENSEIRYSSKLRTLQRELKKKGYVRGIKKLSNEESETYLQKQKKFVTEISKYRKDPSFRFAYLDESYIHTHHHHKKIYWYHPDWDFSQYKHHKNKGERYCIISAIVSEFNGNGLKIRPEKKRSQILHRTTKIFKAKQVHGDYHGNFNSKQFCKWWVCELLPELKKLGGRFVIVMDNAKYHCSGNPDIIYPRDGQRKLDMIECMIKLGILKNIEKKTIDYSKNHYEKKFSKTDLKNICHKWRSEVFLPYTDETAVKAGHIVLRTPPHNCELQPIEFLWAYIKGKVAEKYSINTTFSEVGKNLKLAFQEADRSDFLNKIIEHSIKEEKILEDMFKKKDINNNELNGNENLGSNNLAVEFGGKNLDIEYIDDESNDGDDESKFDHSIQEDYEWECIESFSI